MSNFTATTGKCKSSGVTSLEYFMKLALDQAQQAFERGETPIGCVIVKNDRVMVQSFNTREHDKSPLAHAEIKALLEATKIQGDWRLNDHTLYVTLEPCPMCLGALLQARVGHLIFGCTDEKRQMTSDQVFPSLKNRVQITDSNYKLSITGGILAEESSQLIKRFFKERRINP